MPFSENLPRLSGGSSVGALGSSVGALGSSVVALELRAAARSSPYPVK